MNTMKKIGLFLLLSVAALGQAWGLGMTSVKFDFTSPNDLTRFTGVWGWTVEKGVFGDATAVRQAWESGAFFQTFTEDSNLMTGEKITYNEATGAYTYSPLKYYGNTSGALHVFALVKLPPGMSNSDVPGALVKKYVVAGPWIGEKPAVGYEIKWGVPEDPQTCWHPSVTILSAAQRWPWNGIVDYTYALSDCKASATYKLVAGLKIGVMAKMTTNDLATVANGEYAGTINAATLFPNSVDKAGKIKLQLIEVK